MMNRIPFLATLVALLVVCALMACGGGGNPTPTRGAPQTSASSAGPTEAKVNAAPTAPAASTSVEAGGSGANDQPDPCALLTLDEVKQTMTGFTVSGPVAQPSAQGGQGCVFRATSDELKTTVQIELSYPTVMTYEGAAALLTGETSQAAGATVISDVADGVLLVHKSGKRYVRVEIKSSSDDVNALSKVAEMRAGWHNALAPKIAARLPS